MFGTDGIRGRAYEEITPSLMMRVGEAVKEIFGCGKVVVAHDTRESSPDLVAGLLGGLEGSEVVKLGVAPTPAAAFYGERLGVPALVVSASHNPFYDNGVKIFAPGGRKLSDSEQEDISELIGSLADSDAAPDTPTDAPTVAPGGVGSGAVCERVEDYLAHLESAAGGVSLVGMKLAIDAANGACSEMAPALMRRLGAQVREVCCSPDGRNINDGCGAGFPGRIAAETRRGEIGLAFDGDGDRVVAYDEGLVDGDFIIAICGADRRFRNCLAGNTVVVTVMTNMGFHLSMRKHGIDVVTTPVGDRHVSEALESGGWELGGEQSGHVIFRDLATTGDGLLTAVVLLSLLRRNTVPLSVLAAETMTRFPQVLRNVEVPVSLDASEAAAGISDSVEDVRRRLGEGGRVLVRSSGTEPLVRVMVEARKEPQARKFADSLVGDLKAHLGLSG